MARVLRRLLTRAHENAARCPQSWCSDAAVAFPAGINTLREARDAPKSILGHRERRGGSLTSAEPPPPPTLFHRWLYTSNLTWSKSIRRYTAKAAVNLGGQRRRITANCFFLKITYLKIISHAWVVCCWNFVQLLISPVSSSLRQARFGLFVSFTHFCRCAHVTGGLYDGCHGAEAFKSTE